MLNHMGICALYTSIWDYLRQLTTEARYQELVKSGHWMWVYDNLNMQHKVRHEREGKEIVVNKQGTITICMTLHL